MMLASCCADLSQVMRHILRIHPSAFSRHHGICRLMCQRHLSTWQQPKSQQSSVSLALSLTVSGLPSACHVSGSHKLLKSSNLSSVTSHCLRCSSTDGQVLPPSTPQPKGDDKGGGKLDQKGAEGGVLLSSSEGGKVSPDPGKEKKTPKVLKLTPKPRKSKPLEYSYTGNTYILPVRAMNEYLLKPSDLEGLPKYERRSPYESGPRITVYLRTDVETIAQQVWGSLENVKKERNRIAKVESKSNKYDLFQIRALLQEHKRISGIGDEKPHLHGEDPKTQTQQMQFWKSGSARVVMSAILVNSLNSVLKLIAWLYTGSHSMFSEFVHSVADTMNQIILGIGLYHSIKKPDPDHPYGYSNLRNISSLISGVGIFFFGTGLSFYHGFQGFMHPEPFTSLTWGIATLVGAFVSEGEPEPAVGLRPLHRWIVLLGLTFAATLIIAINQVKKGSKQMGISFWEYVQKGIDPNVSVVLLEDMAAVVGVMVAGTCMVTAQYLNSPVPDALGSCLIGGILGMVASFVIYTNTSALVGKSIPFTTQLGMSQDLENDRMIRSLHDVKATHMGGQIRFKAEVDFDGREITRAYLYKQDMDLLLADMQKLQTAEDVENFMMKHGEKIIDSLGEEVDRIEKLLKKKYPNLRHVDLEAL